MAEPVRRRRISTEQAVAGGVMAAGTLFVLWQLYPSLVLSDTTPASGDLAGHLHEADHLRDTLLPHGRISGWSQDWFTGYPSLTFYFPLGSLLVALLGLLLPLNVAFKLVVVTGPIALPLCAYAFGRLNGRDRLTSTCFGITVLTLLFQPRLLMAGGSIGATAIGEYTYGLSLALGLLVLGLARAGLRTGRHRALTAALLAVTVLLHLVPAVMVIVGMVVATALRPARATVRWAGSVLVCAGLLTGFWAVPFVLRTQLTAGPDYPKSVPVLGWLFPVGMVPVLILAAVGSLIGFAGRGRERDDLKLFMLVMVAVSGIVFAVLPSGRVWNGRFLPVCFLWLCLLAGYGVSGLARAADEWRQRRARGRALDSPTLVRLVVPVALFAAVLPLWDSRLGRGLLTRTPLDLTTTAKRFLEGYERGRHRAEFQGLVDTVRAVGREQGCGRAHWEWDTGGWTEDRVALMWLVPYWADGCMPVTQGLYTQSAASFPYVFKANSRLSAAPRQGGEFDLARGLADLRILGVRYFIATRPETQRAADLSPDLTPVAETKAYEGRFWRIYELSGVEVVEPLRNLPVVVPGAGSSRSRWEDVAGRWFDYGGSERDVVVAAHGPTGWPRRARESADLPRRTTARATVSNVRVEGDHMSFRVSRTGVPVLVKVSYFPNWKASGAEGPWRVTPNQMVVVPTSRTVTLRYGRTPVDYAGWLATLAGVGGLALLARRGPVGMPEPADPKPTPPKATPVRKKPRR